MILPLFQKSFPICHHLIVDSRKYLRILVKMDFSDKIFHIFRGWKTAFFLWWGWLERVLHAMILHVVLNEKSLQRYLFRIKSGCHSLTNLQWHGIWSMVIGQHCYKDKGLFLLSFLSFSIFIVVALEAGCGVWSMMWQTTRIRGKRWTRRSWWQRWQGRDGGEDCDLSS